MRLPATDYKTVPLKLKRKAQSVKANLEMSKYSNELKRFKRELYVKSFTLCALRFTLSTPSWRSHSHTDPGCYEYQPGLQDPL